jgi:16S rRNA processing protein RimM
VAPAAKSDRILLGRIAGAHGIRGEVVIHAHTAAPEDIGAYGPLSDKRGARSFVIRIVRVTPKGVVARLEGVGDRTAAEALKGVELYVDRDRLPAAAEGEFYHADLIGLTAVDPQGRAIGDIVAVPNYGAGDLLEIRPTGSSKSELIPFTEACVPEIDVVARRVVVVRPAASGDADDASGSSSEDGTPRA